MEPPRVSLALLSPGSHHALLALLSPEMFLVCLLAKCVHVLPLFLISHVIDSPTWLFLSGNLPLLSVSFSVYDAQMNKLFQACSEMYKKETYFSFLGGLSMSFVIIVQSLKSCPTLHNPMNCNTPSFPVLHYLPEFAQSHVHRVGDTIQPSHPLLPFSLLALSLSQHQSLFH